MPATQTYQTLGRHELYMKAEANKHEILHH